MSKDPSYDRKVIGLMQLSSLQPLTISHVKEFVQVRHGDRLLLDLHERLFNELTPIELLERMNVDIREDILKLGQL